MSISRARTATLIMALALVSACGSNSADLGPPMGNGPDAPGRPALLPGLDELPRLAPPLDFDQGAGMEPALSDLGEVAMSLPRTPVGERRIVVFDSTGRLRAHFGLTGDGPGELPSASRLVSDGERLVAFSQSKVLVFTFGGELLQEYPGPFPAAPPGGLVGDSIDLLQALPLPGEAGRPRYQPDPILRQAFDRGGRELLPSGHPIVDQVMSARPERADLTWPAYVATADRLVLADGANYRLHVFDSQGQALYQFGRDLEARYETPAEVQFRRERSAARQGNAPEMHPGQTRPTATEPRHLPHFERRGIHFDHQGRLWVIGKVAEQTFLDVFQDSVFLGRHTLDCQRWAGHRPAVQGRWLTVTCAAPDDEYVVRLFRITEPTGGS